MFLEKIEIMLVKNTSKTIHCNLNVFYFLKHRAGNSYPPSPAFFLIWKKRTTTTKNPKSKVSFATWDEKLIIDLWIKVVSIMSHSSLFSSFLYIKNNDFGRLKKYIVLRCDSYYFPKVSFLLYYPPASWLNAYLVLTNWNSLEYNKPLAIPD